MMLRSIHDVRAPGSRRGKRIKNPLFEGFTKDGAHAWMDDDGQPHVRGHILPGTEAGSFEIRATSEEEANKLARRVERDAVAEGKAVERGELEHSEGRVEITSIMKASTAVWARMAAKIALATASHVFDPAWRMSDEAYDLRHVLRDEPSRLLGDKPRAFPKPIVEPFNLLVQPPDHVLFFQRDSQDRVLLFTILFGEQVIAIPVGSPMESLPSTAWRLEPSRPNARGETTFDGLMLRYIERLDDERNRSD
jgi:hypothetical protein